MGFSLFPFQKFRLYCIRTYILYFSGGPVTETTTISLFPSTQAEAEFLRQLAHSRRRPLPALHPGDFSLPAHRLIWRAMVDLAYCRLWIDPQTVAARLARRWPERAGEVQGALRKILE